MKELRLQALKELLKLDNEEMQDLEISNYDDCLVEYGTEEYLVLTDDEADERTDESLENYIGDCVLPEIPEHLQYYFDSESFKRDCLLSDGRGHTLASYDGDEYEIQINGRYFYIYRIN